MISLLKQCGIFYYWPNNGNLGDLLIAEATRQYFSRNGLVWKEYDPDIPPDESNITLVYGGGGRFTSHWGGIELHLAHLTHRRVKCGIILPHSFHDVDWFIKALDARHTIICREVRSYKYCCSQQSAATILLSDDLGLQLKIEELPVSESIPYCTQYKTPEEEHQKKLLDRGYTVTLQKGVKRATVKTGIQKVAFLLRTDKEKQTFLKSPFSYDISSTWNGSCLTTQFNSYMIRAFAEALRYPDIIVTDRLHVGIMAYLLNKEIFLLDNDYGKLSGMYHQSLSHAPNVHLLQNGELPPELQKAWKKLNSPIKIAFHKLTSFTKKVLRYAKKKLGI